nr:glycosyltransferase [Modestobacter versicolor]
MFVTLGTIRGYGFHALLDRVLELGIAGEDTVWQLGDTTPRVDLPGTVHREVSGADFERYATEADVVITHAGVGTVMCLLDLGISPIAVVRRRSRAEHVDDHQQQLAQLMRDTAIGHAVEVEDLDRTVVLAAAGCAVNRLAADPDMAA